MRRFRNCLEKKSVYLSPLDGRVWVAGQAGQQLAGGALLHHPGPQVEGEHGRGLLLLLVQLVRVDLALPHRQRLGLVAGQVLGHGLDVEEDRLLSDTVMVLGVDDELSAVVNLASVDDEGVVVPDVPLHVLDALPELDVVVIPGDAAVGQGDDPAGESSALALQREGGLGLDNKPWRSTLSVNEDLLHPVLLHLELPEGAELGHAAHRQDVVIPVGVLLADLFADGEEPVPGNLQGLVAVVPSQPGVEQTLVGGHPCLLLLDKKLADEVLALLTHVLERLLVK